MLNIIYSDKIKVNCPLIHDENGYYHLIYKITNIKNGKIYIGKHTTKDPYDSYLGSGKVIKQALKKYGIENFTKEILFCFIDEKEVYLKEAEIVTKEFVDRDYTYNVMTGGYGFSSEDVRGENHPNYGKSPSQETRDKISKGNKGKKLTQETKDKISKATSGENNPMYGKPGTRRGKKLTQETKDKMSKAHSGENNPMYGKCGENNPNYGKPRSQETKDKISKAHSGKKHTQETKDKMSKAHSGANSSQAKCILKIDDSGNIVAEYSCKKDCREQEHISVYMLDKLLKERILYNGFYFEYKSKN